MVNYQNGKIYMIMTENSNDIYIGSTVQTLTKRLEGHEAHFRIARYCSSAEIIKQGDYKIVLVKNFACDSKAELEFEETKYQKDMVCVNNNLARLTDEDRKQYDKQYNKQYIIENREKLKQYRIDNKDTIQKWRKTKNLCACGGWYQNKGKGGHMKTKKHLYYLESIKNQKKIK